MGFRIGCLTKSYTEYTFELAWKTMKDYLEEQGFIIKSHERLFKQ